MAHREFLHDSGAPVKCLENRCGLLLSPSGSINESEVQAAMHILAQVSAVEIFVTILLLVRLLIGRIFAFALWLVLV